MLMLVIVFFLFIYVETKNPHKSEDLIKIFYFLLLLLFPNRTNDNHVFTNRTFVETNMSNAMLVRTCVMLLTMTLMTLTVKLRLLFGNISRECNMMHYRMRYRTNLVLSFYHAYCCKSNYNYTNQFIHILYRTYLSRIIYKLF